MPKRYPEEFRRDMIAEARNSEASIRQVAKDFGISEVLASLAQDGRPGRPILFGNAD